MVLTAEQVEDFLFSMGLLASGNGGAQVRGQGVVLNRIGLPAAATNTVHVLSPDASREDTVGFLEQLRDAGLPAVLRARPDVPDWVPEVAAQHGLTGRVAAPIMVAENLSRFAELRGDIVEVDPEDGGLVALVQQAFTTGNGTPPGVFEPLVGPQALRQDGYAAYAVVRDEQVLSVGIRLQTPRAVGVFGIATPPEHRRQGLGEAVTARVVVDGARHGASYAFLGASPQGFGIYERMGFRTAEEWTFYVPGA